MNIFTIIILIISFLYIIDGFLYKITPYEYKRKFPLYIIIIPIVGILTFLPYLYNKFKKKKITNNYNT